MLERLIYQSRASHEFSSLHLFQLLTGSPAAGMSSLGSRDICYTATACSPNACKARPTA